MKLSCPRKHAHARDGMHKTLQQNSPIIQIEMSKYSEFQKLNEKVHQILSNYNYKKLQLIMKIIFIKGLSNEKYNFTTLDR